MSTRHQLWKVMGLCLCMLAVSTLPAAALEKENFNLKTTEDLYMLCSVPPEHGDYAPASYSCRSFILGVVQFHDGISDSKHLPRVICYPEGTTVAEGRVAFVEWVEKNKNNSELMGELPVKGVVRALVEKYPCKK